MSRELSLRHHGFFPGAVSRALPAQRRRATDRPGLILTIGGAVTAILAILEVADAGGRAAVFEDLHVVVAAAAATLAMVFMARRRGAAALRYPPLALAIAATGGAMGILDLAQVVGRTASVVAADVLFLFGGSVALWIIVPSLYHRLDRPAVTTAVVDGGIMLCAGVTLMLTIWRTGQGDSIQTLAMPLMAAVLLASAGVAAILALTLRAAPAFRGVWCGIAGVSVVGSSWILWLNLVLQGRDRDTATSLLYSGGILLIGYAWMTWNDDVGGGARYERIARALVDWLPMGAIVLCVLVATVPHNRVDGIDPAPIGTAAVVLLSISRQRLLIVRERWASHRLAGEVEERAQTMLSLARLDRGETLEQTAALICAEALRLDGIGAAGVYVFGPVGVVPLAMAGACRPDEAVDEAVAPKRALHMRACSTAGAWIEFDRVGRSSGRESAAGRSVRADALGRPHRRGRLDGHDIQRRRSPAGFSALDPERVRRSVGGPSRPQAGRPLAPGRRPVTAGRDHRGSGVRARLPTGRGIADRLCRRL